MSHRWPQNDPVNWVPERPRKEKKDRRVLRGVLVAALCLALLGGLAAGGWFMMSSLLERIAASATVPPSQGGGSDPSVPTIPTSPPSSGGGQTGETSLPRASHGLGVTLELDKSLDRALDPREIYDLVLPSVVSITARTPTSAGSGSGIIMREDGYVLTNYHVIEGAHMVNVMLLSNADSYPARLVGYDDELDVAVLKIDAEGLTAARFGDSDALRVGDAAYAIGNPMGYLYGSMTNGIVSFVDRAQSVQNNQMTLIQTTALLNSGNSGGALVNDHGQVVGITVAKIVGSASYNAPQVEGLGFAIPITAAKPFIDRILDAGETWRPTMGITCQADTEDGVTGIRVVQFTPGGPAEDSGMLPGDLILSANGRPVETLYALKRALNDAGVGGQVTFTVLRDGERMEVSMVLVDSSDIPS